MNHQMSRPARLAMAHRHASPGRQSLFVWNIATPLIGTSGIPTSKSLRHVCTPDTCRPHHPRGGYGKTQTCSILDLLQCISTATTSFVVVILPDCIFTTTKCFTMFCCLTANVNLLHCTTLRQRLSICSVSNPPQTFRCLCSALHLTLV